MKTVLAAFLRCDWCAALMAAEDAVPNGRAVACAGCAAAKPPLWKTPSRCVDCRELFDEPTVGPEFVCALCLRWRALDLNAARVC